MTRRSVLGSLSTGVTATFLMMPTISSALSKDKTSDSPVLSPDGSFSTDKAFFAEFAKTFTIAPRDRYFTAAQKGSMPVPIMKRYKEGLDQVARDPFPVYLEPSEETRKKIARCYGANTDEIAISRNTTDAVAMMLSSMDWKSVDGS
jgi:hypothetical protein